MIQINLLIIFIIYLVYDLYLERKNPLSKQVLKRIAENEKKEKKPLFQFDFIQRYAKNYIKKIEPKIRLKLERSNLNFTVNEYLTFLYIGIGIGFLVGIIVFPFSGLFKSLIFFTNIGIIKSFFGRILAGLSLAYLGTLLPNFIIRYRIKKRKKDLQEQLIDFILGLADGIKTARTPQEALRIVSNELPNPLADELKKTVQEIDFQVPYETALRNLSDRIDIDEYSLVFSALRIQEKTGGHLEKMLRNTAKVAEERRETRAEVLKIVRETRNTAYFLAVAPFFLFAMMFFLMKEDFTTYLYTAFGLIYFSALMVLEVIAFFILKAITKEVEKLL